MNMPQPSHSLTKRTKQKAPFLARLFRMLARLVEGKPAEAEEPWEDLDVLVAVERVASPRLNDPPSPTRVDQAAVDRLLVDIHKSGIKASVGKVQMVHVGAVREALGDKWDRYAGRAMDLAESVLRRHLDPSDLYARYENFAFIVVFTDIDDFYAQERAAAISLEIQYRLLHDPELADKVSVQSVAARIVDMLGTEVPPTVGALSHALDRKAEETPQENRYFGQKSNRTHPGELPSWMGKFSPAYQPMLYTPDQSIGCYFAAHRRRLEDGTWLIGEASYPSGQAGDLTVQMDVLLARRVVGDLRNAVIDGNDALVGTMADIHSLGNTSPLIPHLHKLNNRAREQFVVEIAGVQPGTPLGLMVEVIGILRPFTKHINLRLSLFDAEIEHLATVGLHSIGCDLSAPKLQHHRPNEIADAMESFVARAHALDFHAHFHGVSTVELFATAVRVSADYLTGDAVAPFISSPAGRLRFEQLERAFPAPVGLDLPPVIGPISPNDVET